MFAMRGLSVIHRLVLAWYLKPALSKCCCKPGFMYDTTSNKCLACLSTGRGCEDNAVIKESWTWLTCGTDSLTGEVTDSTVFDCPTPLFCCCNSGQEWNADDKKCAACSGQSPLPPLTKTIPSGGEGISVGLCESSKQPIAGSNGWLKVPQQCNPDLGLHQCYTPSDPTLNGYKNPQIQTTSESSEDWYWFLVVIIVALLVLLVVVLFARYIERTKARRQARLKEQEQSEAISEDGSEIDESNE